MDNYKIGEIISRLRKEQHMTQKDLADKLGVTNKAISKWECNNGYPEITIIPALAEVLNVTTDELLKGEKSNKVHEDDNSINETKRYLVNKSINRFISASYITLLLSFVGLAVFIGMVTLEGSLYYFNMIVPLIVELVFICVSIVTFYIFKNTCDYNIEEYNKVSKDKIEIGKIIDNWYKNISTWLLITVGTISYFLLLIVFKKIWLLNTYVWLIIFLYIVFVLSFLAPEIKTRLYKKYHITRDKKYKMKLHTKIINIVVLCNALPLGYAAIKIILNRFTIIYDYGYYGVGTVLILVTSIIFNIVEYKRFLADKEPFV